ncbi:MAG: lamin tail domain-containing protein, partial [Planctomycetota bacterium]
LLAGFFFTPLGSSNFEIYFIDTGQSDATLLISPTGQTFLFDGGDNGDGNSDVVPLLNSLGINQLDYVGVSHYHADHLGGLDEVWNAGITTPVAYDRGFNNLPGTQSYGDYANRYSSVRQMVTPGQVVNLGGGVTLTCIVREGDLMGGGSVDISGSSQWENSSSVGWLVEYGDFDMWMGGDLTGGGNGTTNVESSVAPLVGDVDVYQANHHGSRTSSNSTWVNTLQPEFTIVPCGSSNPYGYPKQEVLDRLNTTNLVRPVWCPTDGVGTEGFVDAGGNIHLVTDGDSYTVTAEDGTAFTLSVDEQSPAAPLAGELVISEFHRDPSAASDTDGEWVEIAGTRPGAVSLDGVELRDFGVDNFTFASPILLDQGEEVVVAADGLAGRNGGLRPQMVWPSGDFSLSNGSDTIALEYGATVLDRIDYSSGWPGGSGTATEREDLLGDTNSGNFSAAVANYGNGDEGTPGQTNSADTTVFGGGGPLEITVLTPPLVGQTMSMQWDFPGEVGAMYQGFFTLGTTPGYDLGGMHIPANQDRAWLITASFLGWSGVVPAGESFTVFATIPNNPNLHNRQIWCVTYTFDNSGSVVVRKVSLPEFMVIT